MDASTVQTLLIPLVSFAAGMLALLALVRWIGSLLERHPDALRRYRAERESSAWPFRAWRLMVAVAARELPQGALETLRKRVENDVTRAGESEDTEAEDFLGQAVVEGLLIALGLLVVDWLLFGRPLILLALGGGLFHAFLLRPHLLHARANERVGQIYRRLPYAIDLSVLVLRAGGTFREALEMVAKEHEDPLSDELSRALAEIRSGTSQARALSNLAERIRLEELTSLIAGINRGEETGAPLARTLQIQADIFRFRRLQRAERLAVEAPVKMMFPNMLIMASVLLIVLAPVFIKLLTEGLF